MFALWIIEHLNIVEYILPRIISGFVSAAPDTFTLQEVKEAFGNGVVVAVSSTAHAVFEIMVSQKCRPIDAGELSALVGVDQHLLFWLSPQQVVGGPTLLTGLIHCAK
jgi:hypothetical protein